MSNRLLVVEATIAPAMLTTQDARRILMKYGHINLDPRRQHMHIARMVERIAPSTILDVGCSNGLFSKYLGTISTMGINGLCFEDDYCTVHGIEADLEACNEASKIIDLAYHYDLNKKLLSEIMELQGLQFDAIVFADVLEHLVRPDKVLADASKMLSPGGRIFVSIPNIQYFRTRAKIAFGQMGYEDYGPLDRTHVRFFGYESSKKMIDKAGYDILEEHFSVKPSNGIFEALTRVSPSLFAYQFVFGLAPKSNKYIL